MSLSAFGVDHGDIWKGDRERAKQYGRTANTMGALGATTAGIGTGSKIVGHLESKGHDPMGFTMREGWREKPMVPAHRARVLEINAGHHGAQAKYAAGITGAALTVAGAAKIKQKRAQKRALAKRDRRKVTDVALGAGEIGTGSAAAGAGGYVAHNFGRAAYAHLDNARVQGHNYGAAKHGRLKMGVKEKEFTRVSRNVSRRVVGVKGAGALAGAGVVGLGAAGVYQGAQHMKKPRS